MKTFLKNHKEIVMYIVFGVATTLVNWSIYAISVKILHLEMTISNLIAWVFAVIFAFITNKIFVFKSHNKNLKCVFFEFIKFIGSRFATGIIEILLPTFLYKLGLNQSFLGIDGFIAKATVSIVVIILNYVFSKIIVFKK